MTRHPRLLQWIDQIDALTQPDRIQWCDGSQAEWDSLCEELVKAGAWNKQSPGPELPERIVEATRAKYAEAKDRLVG